MNNYYDKKEKRGKDLLEDYCMIREKLALVIELQDMLNEIHKEIVIAQYEEKKIREKGGIAYIACVIIAAIVLGICSLGGVFGFIIGLIPAIILVLIGHKFDERSSAIKRRNEMADEFYKEKIDPLVKKFEETKKMIDELWDSDELKLYERIVPEEYKTLQAIDFFIKALKSGRANSQKEVFNLYEDELYRQKVILMQNEMLDKQDQQLDISKTQVEMLNNIGKNQEHALKIQKKISRQVRYGNAVTTLDFLKAKKVKK